MEQHRLWQCLCPWGSQSVQDCTTPSGCGGGLGRQLLPSLPFTGPSMWEGQGWSRDRTTVYHTVSYERVGTRVSDQPTLQVQPWCLPCERCLPLPMAPSQFNEPRELVWNPESQATPSMVEGIVFLIFFLFFYWPHLEARTSQTRDGTCAPCCGSAEF